ncbi:MAG: TatD family hydrolase [Magnetococcales bacterium]|nr:TatD family hydrolase [Magnetococcales bacterium]
MIDTHCHIDNPAFNEDRLAVIQRAKEAGVKHLVVPGLTLQRFTGLLDVADTDIHLALGLHPLFLNQHPNNAIEQLYRWVNKVNPIAIGEIGLDFREPKQNHQKQQELFEAQLQLAKEKSIPVLIHAVKAHDKVITTLKKTKLQFGGIIHSFNGSLQQAEKYITMGFLLGFGGVVTHNRATKIQKIAASVADTALVLESDAPDLPPAGFINRRNEPKNLPIVVETLAGLRGISKAHIIKKTSSNAMKLLGICNEWKWTV